MFPSWFLASHPITEKAHDRHHNAKGNGASLQERLQESSLLVGYDKRTKGKCQPADCAAHYCFNDAIDQSVIIHIKRPPLVIICQGKPGVNLTDIGYPYAACNKRDCHKRDSLV